MRPCLKCCVKLSIKSVTCPGTIHIQNRAAVYLSISLFGHLIESKAVLATFPLRFNERYKFEKTFLDAQTLDSVQEALEGENVTIELRQYSDTNEGGILLASFVQPTKEFLYPKPSFVAKDGFKRQALLNRSGLFSCFGGLDPQLAFSTQTEIVEFDLVEHYDGNSVRKICKPKRLTKTVGMPSSNSSAVFDNTGNSRHPSAHNSRGGTRVYAENTRIESRNLQSSRDKRKDTSLADRPPFKVGIAPIKPVPSNGNSPPKTPSKRSHDTNLGITPKSKTAQLIAKTPPVMLIMSSSDEEEDPPPESTAINVSSPVKPSSKVFKEMPKRSIITPVRKEHLSPKDVHRRVKRLLAKNASFLDYDLSDDDDSDDEDLGELENYRDSSLHKNGRHWSTTSANYSGRSRRGALSDRYKDIYQRLYEQASTSAGKQ